MGAVQAARSALAQILARLPMERLYAAHRAGLERTAAGAQGAGRGDAGAWSGQVLRTPIIIAVAFTLAALLVRDDFEGPESTLYAAYAASVVADGDLNIANQTDHDVPPDLSSTNAYPDFHNHGGVVIWVPALLLGRGVSALAGVDLPPLVVERYFLSLASLGCALVILLLTLGLVRRVASRRTAWGVTFATAVGTPFVYYVFLEPGQANLPAALFSTLLLYHLWTADPRRRTTWWVTGLLAGLCYVVKVDAWFGLAFALLACLFFQRAHRVRLDAVALAAAGFALIGAAKLVNDRLRLGLWLPSELTVVNPAGSYLLEQLFAPLRGYFYYSPLFLLALAVGLWAALRRLSAGPAGASHDDLEGDPGLATSFPGRTPLLPLALLALVGVIALKLLATAFRFNWGGGTFGGRLLLAELAPFALLFAFGLERLESSRARRWVLALTAAAIAWNGAKMVEFITRAEPAAWTTLAGGIASLGQLARLPTTWLANVGTSSAPDRLALTVPAVLVVAAGAVVVARLAGPGRRLPLAAALMAGCYGVITVLNVVHHDRAAREVAAQVAARGELVHLAPEEFTLVENIVSLDEAGAFFTLSRDGDRACRLARARTELWQGASETYQRRHPWLAPAAQLGQSCAPEAWLRGLAAATRADVSARDPCAASTVEPSAVERRASAELGGIIELVGFDLPAEVAAGAVFPMTLYFRAEAPTSVDYRVFVHFDRGATRFHGNHAPLSGACGTSGWPPGEIIADSFEVLAGERGRRQGRYAVWVGLYHGAPGRWQNLPVTAGEHDAEQRLYLGPIDVR